MSQHGPRTPPPAQTTSRGRGPPPPSQIAARRPECRHRIGSLCGASRHLLRARGKKTNPAATCAQIIAPGVRITGDLRRQRPFSGQEKGPPCKGGPKQRRCVYLTGRQRPLCGRSGPPRRRALAPSTSARIPAHLPSLTPRRSVGTASGHCRRNRKVPGDWPRAGVTQFPRHARGARRTPTLPRIHYGLGYSSNERSSCSRCCRIELRRFAAWRTACWRSSGW